MSTINHPKRRKGDKGPQEWARELRLQEMCNRQDEELRLMSAENMRLRTELAKARTALASTEPIRLAA